MISELKPDEFFKCNDLLQKQNLIEAGAVISGLNPGRVFVDNAHAPKTAIVWLGNNDGFMFLGDAMNRPFIEGLNEFVDQFIKVEAEKVELTWFEAIADHESWYKTFEEVFTNRKLGSWEQSVYRLEEVSFSKAEIPLKYGYSVVKINRSLYENKNLSLNNIQFLHGKIAEFWSSPESFFANGLGYCIVYENEIVSICFSGFVYEGIYGIAIETMAEHQGKRLAEACAHAFVNKCLEQKASPYWDCMNSNKPSIAVAEKLGFKKAFGYTGYDFPLT